MTDVYDKLAQAVVTRSGIGMADFLRKEIEFNHRVIHELLSAFIDAAVMPGHELTPEQWSRACLLAGRHCPPFTEIAKTHIPKARVEAAIMTTTARSDLVGELCELLEKN